MKNTLLLLFYILPFVISGCSDKNDEPTIEKKIEVAVFESVSSKESGFYSPKVWNYCKVMLFDTSENNIDNNDYSQIINGVVKLKDGNTLKAAYSSNTGVLYDIPYGNYTILVYCTENPFNAYLENRFMYKQIDYSKNNAIIKIECCFVYEDMVTTGGWQSWLDK